MNRRGFLGALAGAALAIPLLRSEEEEWTTVGSTWIGIADLNPFPDLERSIRARFGTGRLEFKVGPLQSTYWAHGSYILPPPQVRSFVPRARLVRVYDPVRSLLTNYAEVLVRRGAGGKLISIPQKQTPPTITCYSAFFGVGDVITIGGQPGRFVVTKVETSALHFRPLYRAELLGSTPVSKLARTRHVTL